MFSFLRDKIQIIRSNHSGNDSLYVIYDIFFIILASIFATALAYHPYFFGDELWSLRYAVKFDYSFIKIFHELNASYKPRIVFNAILASLAHFKAERIIYAELITLSYIWINIILYYASTRIFKTGRIIALLLVATVLTSRYGIMFYYDYCAGLLDLLSTGAFFTFLLLLWFTIKDAWNLKFAILTFVFSIITVFISEKYIAALAAAAIIFIAYEFIKVKTNIKIYKIIWALSLFLIPLLSFALASIGYNRSMFIGTANQQIKIGLDTIQCFLAYFYNLFFLGNYGYAYLWGSRSIDINRSGLLFSIVAIALIIILFLILLLKKKLNNRFISIYALFFIIISILLVSSLPGTLYQHPRWVFSAGILVPVFWIQLFKGNWRYIPVVIILFTNIFFLASKNLNTMVQVNSSQTANSIAGALNSVSPIGHRGIIFGNPGNIWIIGGADSFTEAATIGDTFSKVNLRSKLNIEVLMPELGYKYIPDNYDFAILSNPMDNPVFRYVPVSIAMVLGNIVNIEALPIKGKIFDKRQSDLFELGKNNFKFNSDGNINVLSGDVRWINIPASMLKGKIIVIKIKSTNGKNTASIGSLIKNTVSVKIDWYDINNKVLLYSTSSMIAINNTWSYQKVYFFPPNSAGFGHLYLPVTSEKDFAYEIQSIDLR